MTAALGSEEVVYVRCVGATEGRLRSKPHCRFLFNTGPVLAKFKGAVGRLGLNYLG